jgi:hypothetical protein
LADGRQALADSFADLRAQSADLLLAAARLKRTGLDLQAGHPPVSLLLDNVQNLVFRRAYRDNTEDSSQPPVLLFYGADMSAILGQSHRSLSLEHWYRRIHPRDRAAYRAAELSRENFGRGYTIEYCYKHALSGDFRWARETAGRPYDTASGRRLLDSYILDITEQKRAEEALRASEQRYRALVEDQSEYIRRFDAARRLTPPMSPSTGPRRTAAPPSACSRRRWRRKRLSGGRSSGTCARRSSAASWSCSISRGSICESSGRSAWRRSCAGAAPATASSFLMHSWTSPKTSGSGRNSTAG